MFVLVNPRLYGLRPSPELASPGLVRFGATPLAEQWGAWLRTGEARGRSDRRRSRTNPSRDGSTRLRRTGPVGRTRPVTGRPRPGREQDRRSIGATEEPIPAAAGEVPSVEPSDGGVDPPAAESNPRSNPATEGADPPERRAIPRPTRLASAGGRAAQRVAERRDPWITRPAERPGCPTGRRAGARVSSNANPGSIDADLRSDQFRRIVAAGCSRTSSFPIHTLRPDSGSSELWAVPKVRGDQLPESALTALKTCATMRPYAAS